MVNDEPLAKVRYSRRQTQGVVLGIDTAGIVSIGIAAVPVFIALLASKPLQAILIAVILSPLVAGGLFKAHGIPLTVHVLHWFRFKVREARGMTKYRRKTAGPVVLGKLELPGLDSRFEIWETEDGSVVIWDKAKQMASITCTVATQGMAQHSESVLTPHERQDMVAGWMNVCGAWTRRRQIAKVTVQERTRPGSKVREQQHFDALHAVGPLAESYQQALDLLEQHLVWRPSMITITLDCGKGVGKDLVRSHGGGKAGVLALAQQEMGATAEGLAQAGFTRMAWCTPREWAAWGRGIVDPVGEIAVDSRIGTAYEGVAPELAGPMSLDEHKTHSETDSAFHRAYWISEWPRTDSLPGFLGNVVFAETHMGVPVRHTFSLVGTPVPIERAMKRIKKERDTWRQNARLKAARGGMNLADNADWQNLDQREQDLIDGQGELAFSGYLVVTGVTFQALQDACAAMEIAAATAGIEMLTLTHQQQQALITVAYPAGMGMK